MNFYFVLPIKNVQILNPYFCILCILKKRTVAYVSFYMYNSFLLNCVQERAWLGGNDQLREGVWVWTDNSRVNYTHWHFGQPDNRHSLTLEVENCLEINFVALEYWNDEPCCSKRPFICQFW
jgi:hypothetical protein